jgi:hypothetical protein
VAPVETAAVPAARALEGLGRVYRVMRDADSDGLSKFDVRVLHSLPGGWKMISARAEIDLAGVAALFELREKISPLLAFESWGESRRAVVAEFYSDVDPVAARRRLIESGAELRQHPDLLDHQFLAEVDRTTASRLESAEEVAWIFPASDELVNGSPVRACAGAVTEDGEAGSYIQKMGEGWDGPGRGAASLTFAFQNLTEQLPAGSVRSEFARALDAWSRVVQVDFSAGGDTRSTRHLNILFASGDHGDPYPFDGRSRALAHTYFPAPPNPEPIAGDVHFDEDESWSVGAHTDFFSVALHEAGHALGLGHADRPGSVMYPYYRMANVLTSEDIGAVRELYAARDSSAEPPANPQPPQEPPLPGPATPSAPPPPSGPAPATPDRTPPSIRIDSHASSSFVTSSSLLQVRGAAADDRGVVRVSWTSRAGGQGTAEGTTAWSAMNLPLMLGTNYFVFRAYDAAGNSAWRAITVVRR